MYFILFNVQLHFLYVINGLMSLFLIISSKTRHIGVRGGHSPAVVLAGRLPVA